MLRGHVVDFLQLPHWPIFNVADICIDTAAVMIVILARGQEHRRGRHRAAPSAAKKAAEPSNVTEPDRAADA